MANSNPHELGPIHHNTRHFSHGQILHVDVYRGKDAKLWAADIAEGHDGCADDLGCTSNDIDHVSAQLATLGPSMFDDTARQEHFDIPSILGNHAFAAGLKWAKEQGCTKAYGYIRSNDGDIRVIAWDVGKRLVVVFDQKLFYGS